MRKLKIITILGTRPEIIRLSSTIKLLDKKTNHILVHTGQNYDRKLNEIFFNDLSLKLPNYKINSKSSSTIKTVSKILIEVDKILKIEKPDAIIILGDTNSSLSAYCAKRRKIPIFHIEAGNRCYDQRVPEEINRKFIDHIADINVTYSEIAKENLIRENFNPDKVFKIGSPLHEVFLRNLSKIKKSKILKNLGVKKKDYFLISVHREENIDNLKNMKRFFNLLQHLNSNNKKKIIVSTHPRTKIKLHNFLGKNLRKVIFSEPFSYSDYANLQINAEFVLSDSGSITEEASIMGLSAINLRNTNERQEGMSYGMAPMTHFDTNLIDQILKNKRRINVANEVKDYVSENFSEVFYNLLISYINYIRENTWKSERHN